MNWDIFLAPYQQSVEELKIKLRGVRKQYNVSSRKHTPIEFVTGRTKPISSIIDKAKRKKIAMDELETRMQDLAGVRIMCQFVEDIDAVIKLLRLRKDFEIIEERDYISNKKRSGYRAYHLVIKYPVQTYDGVKIILVEIQIKTLAMNFWATIEHSLLYKYSGEIPEEIIDRLQSASEAAFRLDEEMSQIRGEVLEAQVIFRKKEEEQRKK
ncbi:GTP pyrophosphokinase family protein [Bacillaceae bacterium IKA-2]|nr:GTP pyrophosphokinase family protein [Bacillaceae bacterium IKA-2]